MNFKCGFFFVYFLASASLAEAFEEYQAAEDWVGEAYVRGTGSQAAPACKTVNQLFEIENAMSARDEAEVSRLVASEQCRVLYEDSHGVIIGAYRPEMIFHIRLGYAHKLDCCRDGELFIRVENVVNISNHSDHLIETYRQLTDR